MAKTESLRVAKVRDDDEFFTREEDIAAEVERHLAADPLFFKGKRVYCPCDDPENSMFVRFFDKNFEKLGLQSLTATSFVKDGTGRYGKRTKDGKSGGRLSCDGDFRKDEMKEFWEMADIISTNPPFTLFKPFMEKCRGKDCIVLGPQHGTFYLCIFPLVRDRKLFVDAPAKALVFIRPDGTEKKFGNVWWFTTLDTGGRKPMELRTMEENIKENAIFQRNTMRAYGEVRYEPYLNYDGIDAPSLSAIPSDYDGVVGAPAGILARYNKEQFEIVGYSQSNDESNPVPIGPMGADFIEKLRSQGKTGHYSPKMRILTVMTSQGRAVIPFGRVLVRLKRKG